MPPGSRILVLGANGDIGRAVVRSARACALRTVTAWRPSRDAFPHLIRTSEGQQFDWAADRQGLGQVIGGVDGIINCMGITHPPADDPSRRRETFYVNAVLPAILSGLAEPLSTSVVHLSTWAGDSADAPVSLSLVRQLDDIRCAADGNAAEEFVDACRSLEGISPYLASKLLLESMVAQSAGSVAVRVTNVYGPGLTAPRLVPRLIGTRLQGGFLCIEDEPRNYSTCDELARFLLACVSRPGHLPGPVIGGFGSTNTTVRRLATAVERALPTCYGQLIVRGNASPPVFDSSFEEYFPDLAAPLVDLQEVVRQTAREWRRTTPLLTPQTVGAPGPAQQAGETLAGGSIAQKRLVSGAGGVQYVEKKSSVDGYEGAARPKLRAERRFYIWLAREAPSPLRELFVTACAPDERDEGLGCRTKYDSGGLTIADALASFPSPRLAMRDLVAALYASSYLRDLVSLSRTERLFHLGVLYLDRAADRLHSFLRFAVGDSTAPAAIRSTGSAILEGRDLEIDGRTAANPLAALDRIANSSESNRLRYAPTHVGPCGHGDLTILNMLWRDTSSTVRLIDPRGLIGPLDPIYDLGKFLFSLSGFALLMRGGLKWAPASAREHRVEPVDAGLLARCTDEHAETLTWLAENPTFADLRTERVRFHHQLVLAEATHYLADVPYRYAQGRDWNGAMCAMLLGTKRLADFDRLKASV